MTQKREEIEFRLAWKQMIANPVDYLLVRIAGSAVVCVAAVVVWKETSWVLGALVVIVAAMLGCLCLWRGSRIRVVLEGDARLVYISAGWAPLAFDLRDSSTVSKTARGLFGITIVRLHSGHVCLIPTHIIARLSEKHGN
jgi:hypothetical protein